MGELEMHEILRHDCLGNVMTLIIGSERLTLAGVLQREVLVVELLAVDALAARAVAPREVAALAHEAGNDAMEFAALVAEALLHRAQRAEVLRRPGHHVRPQLRNAKKK